LLKKYLFLDRDGVIIEDRHYVHNEKEMIFLPLVKEGITRFQNLGFEIVIITNQSGIARGYFTFTQYRQFSKIMLKKLGLKDINIKMCPHHKDGKLKKYSIECDCRKPKTGLVNDLTNINFDQSIMVGDKISDAQFANNLGIKFAGMQSSIYFSDYDMHWIRKKGGIIVENLVELHDIITGIRSE
jgi:D-glycero-D-manno-heptose 1,7-bisphosphate phosphatase